MAKTTEELPHQKYLSHQTNSGAYFILLSEETPPSIWAAIFINSDLEAAIYQKQLAVPFSAYKRIQYTLSNKVTLLPQVLNLMTFGKNIDQKKYIVEEQFQSKINDLICDFLLNTENQRQISFLKFIAEQISLVFISKHRRSYSAELLMIAYIHVTNPRAYARLIEEQAIVLPSTKTLNNITLILNSTTGLDDE